MVHAALLTTKDLAVGYRGRPLFSGINLTLEPGQLVCFMGPNGIGKSTLIRTLAGLQTPLSGTIDINAQEKYPRVAVVLTDKVSMMNITVADVVAMGRYPYLGWNISLTPHDKAIVHEAIRSVNIEAIAGKPLDELSDGQFQLTMLARALAQETPVILLDEPTSHLDLNNRVEVMNLLRDIARSSRRAILAATHELDLALQTADSMWLAGKDNQIVSGAPEDLVLQGEFDAVFGLKGFDLRTGKMIHAVRQSMTVQLVGEGYWHRWTRNALERTGYRVSETHSDLKIEVQQLHDAGYRWIVEGTKEFTSVRDLLDYLKRL